MHRIYTREEYEEKVAFLREIVPHVALGTDIIVGFPTETDEEFEETCHAMETIRFATAFLFAYSPRKGTPSSRWKDDVLSEVKEQRLQRLLELQEAISYNDMQSMVHTTAEVLVEAKSFKDSTMVKGRTRGWKNVVFPGSEDLIGTLQQVKLHSFTHQTFVGERLCPTPGRPKTPAP